MGRWRDQEEASRGGRALNHDRDDFSQIQHTVTAGTTSFLLPCIFKLAYNLLLPQWTYMCMVCRWSLPQSVILEIPWRWLKAITCCSPFGSVPDSCSWLGDTHGIKLLMGARNNRRHTINDDAAKKKKKKWVMATHTVNCHDSCHLNVSFWTVILEIWHLIDDVACYCDREKKKSKVLMGCSYEQQKIKGKWYYSLTTVITCLLQTAVSLGHILGERWPSCSFIVCYCNDWNKKLA